MTGESFIDVDVAQHAKHGQVVSGDVFISRKIKEEGRVVAVLSDGLGSGVKASVLANMTAAMAMKYTAAFVDIRNSASTIMDTLPICEVRKISYSTFTIIDVDDDGSTRIVEHGNPPMLLLRGTSERPLAKTEFRLPQWKDRVITYAETTLQLGDRIICCSDGVSQSGMEQRGMPMGWGRDAMRAYAIARIKADPEISSAELASALVDEALANDHRRARDDITCGVLYFRRPRRLLVVTGPPFARQRDAELAASVRAYNGRKAVCGGTTATILSRELQQPVTMDLSDVNPDVPPASLMDGIDLVTEGTLTLARAAEELENGRHGARPANAATRLAQLMQESDVVDFLVGTRINEAHQDPNIPVELDLRRNIIRRIAGTLERTHLKRTSIRFL